MSAPPPPFPTAALGPLLSAAVTSVAAQTQAPAELIAHHILTLAAMAAQRLVSVRLPTGAQRPVSCFFATLIGAGEGRGAAEKMLVDTARLWERGFEDEFPMRVAAHIDEGVDNGVQRPKPLRHLNLFYDPRVPQPDDRYRAYTRQSGLFARHPHELLQPGRSRRAEAASLCALWNGKVVQRAVGPTLFPRLSAHLATAPRVGRAFLGESELADAGLLGRMLVAAPASRLGARTFRLSNSDDPPLAFQTLLGALGAFYEKHPSADTRLVTFSNDAAAAWLSYVQEVEAAMAPGAVFYAIRPFAGHLPEHAARLAVLIALMEDGALAELTMRHLEQGVALARYYTEVRLRMQRVAPVVLSDEEQEEILKDWLAQRPAGEGLSLRDVCRVGPPQLRNADTAYKLMRRMERLGVVQPANPDFAGASRPRRPNVPYAWRVSGEASVSEAPSAKVSQSVA
ncbi:MAG: DUF3987 domain-containing protein [Proteobacteria bacterium]|nr:DUF3987 domain-containing protein [Pseudomonadota bacterium]